MGTQIPARPAGLNQAVVVGQLVAKPDRRELPSGSVAVSFSITVRSTGLKTTSVPVVWYDPPDRVDKWAAGDIVIALGPVVRRFFRGGAGLNSATELVVDRAELARHERKAQHLLASAARFLSERSKPRR